jgi:hypothetical protein
MGFNPQPGMGPGGLVCTKPPSIAAKLFLANSDLVRACGSRFYDGGMRVIAGRVLGCCSCGLMACRLWPNHCRATGDKAEAAEGNCQVDKGIHDITIDQ